MTITLLLVDTVDADVIRRLDVHENQMDFIASNDESLEELGERPECVGFAVMAQTAPNAGGRAKPGKHPRPRPLPPLRFPRDRHGPRR